MQRFRKKSFFTLVELLVALGIFSILLVIMMQFFSGAQKIWTSSEARRGIYRDADVAMELICTMLKNIKYEQDANPLQMNNISPANNDDSQLYFLTKTTRNIGGVSELKFVSFQTQSIAADSNNAMPAHKELQLRVFCDKDENFDYCFQPFSYSNYSNITDVKNRVVDSLNNSNRCFVLLKNLRDFKVTVYLWNNSSRDIELRTTDLSNTLPILVEVKISVIDPAFYNQWYTTWGSAGTRNTDENDFFLQHGYTFRRMVYLDQH